MTCEPPARVEDVCLTQPQALDALIALLPRGRAWTTTAETPVRRAALNAIASLWAFIEARICAARLEFFCQTHSETHDLWLADYGLPDDCDPFPDLCAKVAAVGGTRCDYYVDIAARAGWAIECVERACGGLAGHARAGCSVTGLGPRQSELYLRVNLSQSPAYSSGYRTPPLAGRLRAGQPLACPPDLSPLKCLLERVVHAHVLIIYEPYFEPDDMRAAVGWLVPALAA